MLLVFPAALWLKGPSLSQVRQNIFGSSTSSSQSHQKHEHHHPIEMNAHPPASSNDRQVDIQQSATNDVPNNGDNGHINNGNGRETHLCNIFIITVIISSVPMVLFDCRLSCRVLCDMCKCNLIIVGIFYLLCEFGVWRTYLFCFHGPFRSRKEYEAQRMYC